MKESCQPVKKYNSLPRIVKKVYIVFQGAAR